ncbi:hypothetical protein HK104_003661, partial [Borealophlyctis nickersoniae]
TIMQHIQRGVEVAAADPSALLVFSGGEARVNAGPRSEAQSYWTVADAKNKVHQFSMRKWFGHDIKLRATTEEFALDSFQNLMFRITVVGFEFKRERFVNLHRVALRFSEERFTYEGIDPPDIGNAMAGEVN